MPLEEVNSLEATAEYLTITPEVLRRMARSQQIGAMKIGAKWLFPRTVIETNVEQLTRPQVDRYRTGMTPQSRERLRRTN